MFRNNTNAAVPPFLGSKSSHFQFPADAPNQLQLCVDAQKASIFNKNPVSTGLRLSYDDDERNSTVSSASESMIIGSSIFSSLHVDIERELDKNRKELEHYVRIQEENLLKGLREIRQRHFTSCLTYLESSCVKKLNQKNLELETVTCKNIELVERAKQLTAEAENWCNIAKYNESVANALKSSLEQAVQQGSNRGNMVGENDVDDAASCIDPNNFLSNSGERERSSSVNINALICRCCKSKEVSIVLMPCRHLCLCKECEGFVGACPVCRMVTNASFENKIRLIDPDNVVVNNVSQSVTSQIRRLSPLYQDKYFQRAYIITHKHLKKFPRGSNEYEVLHKMLKKICSQGLSLTSRVV